MRVQRLLLVGVVAFAAAVAARARAAGPLLVNGTGTPLVWAVPIPFNVDQGKLGARTNAQAVGDVTTDFGVWAAVTTANISFTNAGALPVDVTLANYANYVGICNDGRNPIIFDTDGTITEDIFGAGASNDVIASANPDCEDFDTATITEGSAVLNGKFIDGVKSGANPEISLADFNAVVIREFGHYINLDNSQINLAEATDQTTSNDNAVATMYPFLVNGTEQSTLNLDDMVSVSTLYPAASFSSSFGRITGTILLPNREGAFQGAYVIARQVGDPRLTAVGAASGARFFPRNPGGTPSPTLRAFYEIPGLPPGNYTVEIEAISPSFTGSATVGPLDPPVALPGPAEFWNGANESNTSPPDDPTQSVPVTVTAGSTVSGINIIINGAVTGPANDACTTPTMVGAVPFSTKVSTAGATTGIFDPLQSCTFGGPNQNRNSVWYSFTAPGPGQLTADTFDSDYDTVLSTYTGSCEAFSPVPDACDDDVAQDRQQSQVSFQSSPGTTYYFMVSAYDGDGGSLVFHLNFLPTPTSTPVVPTATPTRRVSALPTPLPTDTRTPTPSPTPTRGLSPSHTPTPASTVTPLACFGDCNGDGAVRANELITVIAIIGHRPTPTGTGTQCGPADAASAGDLMRVIFNIFECRNSR